jgi:hypothetical protein
VVLSKNRQPSRRKGLEKLIARGLTAHGGPKLNLTISTVSLGPG